MEEGYKLQEFHCAANTSQPVHISSYNNTQAPPIGPLCSKKLPSFEDRRKNFIKGRSNTMYFSGRSFKATPDPNSKGKLVTDSTFLFRPFHDAGRSSIVDSTKALFEMNTKSLSADPFSGKDPEGTKSRSTTDSESSKGETGATEEQLKEKLAESLSPSPFRNEDPNKREARLEQLVASAPCTTKTILFSPFYGSELTGEGSHRAWKIALKDHIVHTLESICLIKKLSPVPAHIIEKKKLPVEPCSTSTISSFNINLEKKLVVFDLDETLVHCVTDNIEKADRIITVTLNTNEKIKAGVNIRPYAVECLKQLSEYYELIVFTASHPYYADTVIDLLDPDKTIFSKRLFRNSCIRTDIGLFIKDLRVLNCDFKSTVIVDNAIFSFAFQLDNGIPIIPFYDDKEDRIMPKIRDYLVSLKDLEDVRVINKKTFSLTELYELDISSFLKYYYDDPSDKTEENKEKEVELEEVEEDTESPRSALRRKSYSFVQTGEHIDNPFKIGKKAQAVVDDQLGKLRLSLPRYLASQQQQEEAFTEHKYECQELNVALATYFLLLCVITLSLLVLYYDGSVI
eukprot:TRINITY_DN1893_c0_g1_i1.p2 TRINITY_DN1893_c0_g1~~TRINITY_DN1893_c0_g1_i1.p2  ORF type:complete len:570 (-),score=59.52 TRINITY_DN1893_c0_g1_i1:7307-9016(-)